MNWCENARAGRLGARAVAVALAIALCLVPVAGAQSTSPSQAPPLERLTVQSDGHPIAVWTRRPAAPSNVVLLVHGRTWSSRPDFDLQVPGLQRSVLTSLAARRIAGYAIDLRGYGGTPRDPSGWMTPRRATADILNVLSWIAGRHPELPRPALVGWSRGAALAMLAAQRAPARVGSLVMFGFAFDPDATFVDAAQPRRPQRARNTAESAAADFISPRVTPPAVITAFVTQALAADPVLADLRGESDFNELDPAALDVPTLLIYGERDPGVIKDDATRLFERLRTRDKEQVVLPGADHAAHIEDTHDAWMDAVVRFTRRFGARP
jgi:pimeloyl-ACP methyl ester carboxylesterase